MYGVLPWWESSTISLWFTSSSTTTTAQASSMPIPSEQTPTQASFPKPLHCQTLLANFLSSPESTWLLSKPLYLPTIIFPKDTPSITINAHIDYIDFPLDIMSLSLHQRTISDLVAAYDYFLEKSYPMRFTSKDLKVALKGRFLRGCETWKVEVGCEGLRAAKGDRIGEGNFVEWVAEMVGVVDEGRRRARMTPTGAGNSGVGVGTRQVLRKLKKIMQGGSSEGSGSGSGEEKGVLRYLKDLFIPALEESRNIWDIKYRISKESGWRNPPFELVKDQNQGDADMSDIKIPKPPITEKTFEEQFPELCASLRTPKPDKLNPPPALEAVTAAQSTPKPLPSSKVAATTTITNTLPYRPRAANIAENARGGKIRLHSPLLQRPTKSSFVGYTSGNLVLGEKPKEKRQRRSKTSPPPPLLIKRKRSLTKHQPLAQQTQSKLNTSWRKEALAAYPSPETVPASIVASSASERGGTNSPCPKGGIERHGVKRIRLLTPPSGWDDGSMHGESVLPGGSAPPNTALDQHGGGGEIVSTPTLPPPLQVSLAERYLNPAPSSPPIWNNLSTSPRQVLAQQPPKILEPTTTAAAAAPAASLPSKKPIPSAIMLPPRRAHALNLPVLASPLSTSVNAPLPSPDLLSKVGKEPKSYGRHRREKAMMEATYMQAAGNGGGGFSSTNTLPPSSYSSSSTRPLFANINPFSLSHYQTQNHNINNYHPLLPLPLLTPSPLATLPLNPNLGNISLPPITPSPLPGVKFTRSRRELPLPSVIIKKGILGQTRSEIKLKTAKRERERDEDGREDYYESGEEGDDEEGLSSGTMMSVSMPLLERETRGLCRRAYEREEEWDGGVEVKVDGEYEIDFWDSEEEVL